MSFGGMRPQSDSAERPDPDCYCHTCERDIHHLGIMSHRAAHRRKNEVCVIEYSDGRTIKHDFSG
jgi:hypothetical protein